MGLELLLTSGISRETALRAGVYEITNEEAHGLGCVGGDLERASLCGLAFPYRHPCTGALLVTRIRPDVPVNGRKYVAPAGSRNHLYLPCVLLQHLDDTRFDVLIVEGEKKALSLIEAVGTRYLVVGIGGVWNWRTSDKEKRPAVDGGGTETVRVNSRPLEDFAWITWANRRVFIVFDSDGSKNPDVQRAEEALAKDLRKRKACPLVVTLPPGSNGEKQGIDDLLVREPVERRLAFVERLLAGAAPRRKRTADGDTKLDLSYEPTGGFMRTFDEYVDPITDAPGVYRPFTALAILGAVVGRHITAKFGAQRIVPNLYMCVLGPSSLFRKTTMITIAEELIVSVRPDISLPHEVTTERLIDVLSRSPQGFFGLREFTGFLARATRDYMSGAKEFLMEIYDCPEIYRRELRKEQVTIHRPTVTILAASVTTWLSEALEGADLRSGFLNRFCFALADRKTKLYPIPRPADECQRGLLADQLRAINEIRGDADLSAVEASYTSWLRDLYRQAERADHPEIIAGFYTRLSIVALKYAILLEVAQSGGVVVSVAALEEALVLVEYHKAVVTHLLRVEFGRTQSEKRSQRVLQVIRKWPGVKRGEIYRKTGYDKREAGSALEVLAEQGDIYEADGGFWPTG